MTASGRSATFKSERERFNRRRRRSTLSGHWEIAEADIATVAVRKHGDAGKREIEGVAQRT